MYSIHVMTDDWSGNLGLSTTVTNSSHVHHKVYFYRPVWNTYEVEDITLDDIF